ncbi:cytochrome c oxidase accessory protein CcoG [Fulvivirgaceae bacterium LMO-SS25]
MAKPTDNLYGFDEEYRDTIATVDASGKRIWVYPKKPSGRFHNWRAVVAVVLLTLLFGAPWIKIDGQPLMLFNVFERKFVIFGQVFWPQDFFLFAIFLITLFVFIILFTVLYGRIWCGWACPQTIFMEMVFRKIEYWIEGDANMQRKLAAAPWNREKILKKGFKQLIFLTISIVIAHTVMAYLIGVEQVKLLVTQSPTENLAGFIGLVAFTGVFYWVFSYFREQACVAVCPYGRLQGVLLTRDSFVIIYDWIRGEPRGKLKKNDEANAALGDCIDCKLCVHACPTGIDIRNGTQLECVNCTACIDACDTVMTKIGKPTGLIRFDSHSAISEGKKFKFNARVAGYSVILTVLVVFLGSLLFGRTEVETTVLRVPGQLFQERVEGEISNLYNAQFINKTNSDMELDIRVVDFEGAEIEMVGRENIMVKAGGFQEIVFFLNLPKSMIESSKTSLKIEVLRENEVIDVIKTNFLGPVN